jgi:hypothetical protein
MALLIVTGRIHGQSTTFCNFTVSVNNGPFIVPDSLLLDQSFFTIPDQAAQISVRADALDPSKYPALEGTFQIDDAGNMVAVVVPAEFEPPNTIVTPLTRTIFLTIHFTPFRDVTERARQCLSPTGADFPGSPPAPSPGDMSFRQPFFSPLPPAAMSPLAPLNDITFIAAPSVNGSNIQVVARSSVPQGQVTILEIPGAAAPRLVAVYWPDAVPRGPGAGPTPFLVYFHPTAGQNAPGFYVDQRDRHDPATGSTYPWGFDYQFFGFWRYLNYERDPLKGDPFCKGLPYQIDASGKNAVLVLLLNKVAGNPCDEVLSFTDASFLQEHLQELQSFMFRRDSNYQSSGLGRLAMASFSSGHSLLSCFLTNAANQMHPLFLDTLQEIYLFDPHADLASETLQPTTSMALWASRGMAATKVARLYTQNDATTLSPVLAQLGLSTAIAPFDLTAPLNPRKSVACLPLAAWNALAMSVGSTQPYNNTQAAHQVISALMLTDAMRRSDF